MAAPSGEAWTLDEISADAGWSWLFSNIDVNAAGQIVGISCRENGAGCHGVRLDPVLAVPEPGIYAMLAAGLGIAGWRARRRGD